MNHHAAPSDGAANTAEPPCLVWETTRACPLACSFCRSAVEAGRHYGELSTLEAFRMLNELRAVGPVRVLLAGGDPLLRPDLTDLVEHATRQGLQAWITLCPTAAPGAGQLHALAAAGLRGVIVRSAGADAPAHDRAAGIDGAGARLEALVAEALGLGLEVERTPDGHVPDVWALRVEATGVVRLAGDPVGDVRRDDVAELASVAADPAA